MWRGQARARRAQLGAQASWAAQRKQGAFHPGQDVFHGSATMIRLQLDERQWQKIKAVLDAMRRSGRPGQDDRNFLEAVLWWRRTGAPWRDLPSEFGPWKTVFNRFDRWSSKGVWLQLFRALRQDSDDEWHSIDSTINRAHQHAAGAKGGLCSMALAVRGAD